MDKITTYLLLFRVSKSRIVLWTGGRHEEDEKYTEFLIGKPEEKRLLWSFRHGW
jgi:hypothetical protein